MGSSTPKRALLALCAVLLVPSLVGYASAQDDGGDSDDETPSCLTITGSAHARGYGYNHVVTVRNECEQTIVCEVWTTTDPTPKHRLVVPRGESRSVTTRGGSPAREVQARHRCRWQR